MTDDIDWKEAARRAAYHIEALLMYAGTYPRDSHPNDADAFLTNIRRELGITTPHRTAGQWTGNPFSLPLTRITPNPEPVPEIADKLAWALEQMLKLPRHGNPGFLAGSIISAARQHLDAYKELKGKEENA